MKPTIISFFAAICGIMAVPAWGQAITDDRWEHSSDVEETASAEEGDSWDVVYRLESVRIKGNRRTNPVVILRELPFEVGDLFSVNDEQLSAFRYKLLSMGLFHEVQLKLGKGHSRHNVVLTVKVVERNTIVIRDLSLGLTRVAPHWDEVVPFGGIGVEESSFLGTGISVGAAIAASPSQFSYALTINDTQFMNSPFGLHVRGIFVKAEEYFGEHYLSGPDGRSSFGQYETLRYKRAGIRLGTGYNIRSSYYIHFGYRFENILAEEPKTTAGSYYAEFHKSYNEPVGYLEPDSSVLSSFQVGLRRSTLNRAVLPYRGALTEMTMELSHPVMASMYEYAKFVVTHTKHYPFGRKGQNIAVKGIAGLITGNAPFFDQFFIGDYSALVPGRQLGLNFSNLHPEVLTNGIQHMWYEDLVLSAQVEYSFPFYRGSGVVYGVNGFLSMGAYSLSSSEFIDGDGMPIDLTGDLGIRIDTRVGVFTVSFANVLQLIPPVRKETTK